MSDSKIEKELKDIREELTRLEERLDKIVIGAGEAAVDNSRRLGAAVRTRLEALEAIVGILLSEVGQVTKEKVRGEIKKRNATWLLRCFPNRTL